MKPYLKLQATSVCGLELLATSVWGLKLEGVFIWQDLQPGLSVAMKRCGVEAMKEILHVSLSLSR